MNKTLSFITLLLLAISCNHYYKNETNLSVDDLDYLNTLVLLDKDENIQLFETNGGLKGLETAGNFITNKRVVSYWIDGKNNEIHSILYPQIDSIKVVNHIKTPPYASYIQIYGSNNNFKVYVDADSTRTWLFFNTLINNWNSNKL